MKRIFTIIFMLVLMFAYKTNVFALPETCTTTEQMRLRALVNATQIKYDFHEGWSGPESFSTYVVTIDNFKQDFYVYDETTGTSFEYSGSESVISRNFSGGITYKFPFYASKGTPCEGYLIMTKNLQLVPYNPYSKDPLCVGHETYELCKKFTPIKIPSQQDFEQRLEKYIKDLEKTKEPEPIPEKPVIEESVTDKILSFIYQYYMYFLITIIVSGISGIIYLEFKRRRSIL